MQVPEVKTKEVFFHLEIVSCVLLASVSHVFSISGIYKAPITSGSKWHGPPMEGRVDKITVK